MLDSGKSWEGDLLSMVPFLCHAVSSSQNIFVLIDWSITSSSNAPGWLDGSFFYAWNCTICKYVMKNLSCRFTLLQNKTLLGTTAKKSVSFLQCSSCQTLVTYLLFSPAQSPCCLHIWRMHWELLLFHWCSLGGTVKMTHHSSRNNQIIWIQIYLIWVLSRVTKDWK